MKIENIEKNQYFELVYKYEYDGYSTYDIFGKNKLFSGGGSVCVNNKTLLNFITTIKTLEVGETTRINDNDSDAYFELKKIDSLGHYNIIYQIGGTHQDNYSKLIINTDTIGLKKFSELVEK